MDKGRREYDGCKNMIKVDYSVKRLRPNVYLCTVEDMYDLCMTFCRVQEFYESPFKEIRGHKFSFFEYMKLYSKRNGCFTYTQDWGGFNVPGPIVDKLFKLGIDDMNVYDTIIKSIHDNIIKKQGNSHYYLIGSNTNKRTIEHELCHAFYFLDGKYKEDINAILKKLIKSGYKKMIGSLIDIGYCKDVLPDELQAYLITDSALIDETIKYTKKELENKALIVCELKQYYKKYKANEKNIKTRRR